MKKIFLLFWTVLSFSANSGTYLKFHQYVYSIPVGFKKSDDLRNVLIKNGYNLKERDWTTITLHMNGLTKEQLSSVNHPITIYLPPKKPYSDFIGNRNMASTRTDKKICKPVSKNYLVNRYGRNSIPYLEYYELITSRKIHVSQGTSLYSIIQNDQFSYGTEARAMKLIREANGIRSSQVEKDGTIHLPFCADALAPRRVIASAPEVKEGPGINFVVKKPFLRKKEEERSLKLTTGVSYGSVDIQRSSSKLSTNFVKASFKGHHKLNNDYSTGLGVSLVQFFNVTHSDSTEKKSASSIYPEFGADITRSFNLFSVSLAYDSMNYFFASNSSTTVILDPVLVHRLSLKPVYNVTDDIAVFGGMGYLKSFGSEKINGYDYTLGTSYLFGMKNDCSLSALMNQNVMATAQSNANDKSSSWVVSLSKIF